jgi:hypothetical protein
LYQCVNFLILRSILIYIIKFLLGAHQTLVLSHPCNWNTQILVGCYFFFPLSGWVGFDYIYFWHHPRNQYKKIHQKNVNYYPFHRQSNCHCCEGIWFAQWNQRFKFKFLSLTQVDSILLELTKKIKPWH